jgi:hypothetical protein
MAQFKIFIIIIIAMLTIKSFGQQDAQYSLFWNNLSIYNPAETGGIGRNKNYLKTNGQISVPGIDSTSIRTFNVLYELRLDSSKNGIGINYQQDKVGNKINNQANFNYARWMRLGRGELSSGIAVGFASNNFFNINGGLMYTTNRLKTGIGVTHINHSNYEPLKYNFSKTKNYYFNFQYTLFFASLTITPTIFIRSIISSTVADLSILTSWNRSVFIGAGYRTSKAILLTVGIPIKKKILIAYAYNYVQPNASVLNKSSHEVVLSIHFK